MTEEATFFLAVLLISSCLRPIRAVTFYPYGSATDDLTLLGEGTELRINLTGEFLFFGETFRQIRLTDDGLISFDGGAKRNEPAQFPLEVTKCVAPYWVDCDPDRGGKIFYREVRADPTLLASISDDVRAKVPGQRGYSSTWAFVVTFDGVPRYGCTETGNPCTNVVTHQTVLTSNGLDSFAVFLYRRLDFGGAVVGVNAGDGRRYAVLPYSNTANSSAHALGESNVGEPGKWIFPVGSDGCNSNGRLTVTPGRVLYYGGEEVTVTGPCLGADQSDVAVMFGDVRVLCPVADGQRIVCKCPYADVIGRIDLRLSHGSVDYSGFVVTYDESDDSVKVKKVAVLTSPDVDADAPFTLTWEPTSGDGSVLLSGMQEDIVSDAGWNVIGLSRQRVSVRIPNTGSYEHEPSRIRVATDPGKSADFVVRKICLFVQGTVLNRIVVRVRPNDSCSVWYNVQPNERQISEILERESSRNPCKPTAVLPPLGFETADACPTVRTEWCSFFHPWAKACYRSTDNPSGAAVQCCYDDNDQLLTGILRGGTLNMQDPRRSRFGHFMADVFPYLLCCRLQSDCGRYYEKRPPVNSAHFASPLVQWASGDPHFVTFDGVAYDFNPVGEFVYLQAPNLTVQARMSEYRGARHSLVKGSCFTALAVKSYASEPLQLELSADKTLQVKVGRVPLSAGTWKFDNFTVSVSDGSSSGGSAASVETPHGFRMQVELLGGILHVIVVLGQSLKGKVGGLVGRADGDPENDLTTPEGTVVSRSSSTAQAIHNDFGMKWKTTEEGSLFVYSEGGNWTTHQDPRFEPYFGPAPSFFGCEGDADCSFDYHVTRDINVGLTNVEVKRRAGALAAAYREAGLETTTTTTSTTSTTITTTATTTATPSSTTGKTSTTPSLCSTHGAGLSCLVPSALLVLFKMAAVL